MAAVSAPHQNAGCPYPWAQWNILAEQTLASFQPALPPCNWFSLRRRSTALPPAPSLSTRYATASRITGTSSYPASCTARRRLPRGRPSPYAAGQRFDNHKLLIKAYGKLGLNGHLIRPPSHLSTWPQDGIFHEEFRLHAGFACSAPLPSPDDLASIDKGSLAAGSMYAMIRFSNIMLCFSLPS
jgi:hypothetical protein